MSNEITYESMRRTVGVSHAAAAAADPITRILTSRFLPQDVQAQLSDKALRKRIRLRCDELLRRMKAAAGINLTRYDTIETRSAIVLEFVLRTGLPDDRDGHNSVACRAVPLGVLASQVGVKKEFAEDTQRALVHYLNDAANAMDGRRRKTRSSGSALDTTDAYATRSGGVGNGMSNSRGGTSRNAGNESNAAAMAVARDIVTRSLQQPETIRDLSIRLGSMVEDADGSARSGEALFENIVQHIISTEKFSKEALLSDIERNKASYEAACFYLSANDSEGTGGGSTKKKKLNSTKAGTGDGAQSDEDEERNLIISDIMDAAKLGNRKDFEEIVRQVSKIAAGIRLQREANNEEERSNREGTELLRTKNATKGAKKRQRGDSNVAEEERGQILPQDILMAAEEKEWRNDVSDGGTNSASKRRSKRLPAFVPSAAFLEWKKRTLDAAITRAKGESGDGQMTNQEALEWAVKDIISRKDYTYV